MENRPSIAQLPEVAQWEDMGVATETQLNMAADMRCRDAVGAEQWDRMSYGQRRVHLLNTMYGEGGWNMVAYEEPGKNPTYSTSVGMYSVETPPSFRIQRKLPVEQ